MAQLTIAKASFIFGGCVLGCLVLLLLQGLYTTAPSGTIQYGC